MTSKALRKGDKVAWETSQGRTTGNVVRKATGPMKIKGHKVAASADNPEYVVKSAKSGDLAAHKPDALTKV